MAGEQFCGRGPGGFHGEQAEQEPAVQPDSKVANKAYMDRSTARRVTHGASDWDVSEGSQNQYFYG